MNTAIIIGSSRSKGNTAMLVKQYQQAATSNVSVYDLNTFTIGEFDYTYQNKSDDFNSLFKQLLTYQRLIFATPVYWYSPSARMKIFLDRISDLLSQEKEMGRALRGKYVALLATGGDVEVKPCFEEIFIHTFDYLGCVYDGMLYIPFDGNTPKIPMYQLVEQFVS
ncbi:flavodoxin family protein [Shewanella sp. OMA3-2]|uniref:flavodoxin family protein n=1 Tax=Shewanella sp. OMA3-2 TaxID=2908650 RepID=UPI001F38088C|nr:NAD(P)H-dependent oxidoreductase [Shewanella sp. OMA3-2]UJF20665.1 NAD(P)H-dependent oxidoreductase [Shewanella sp. OMA3-2]